MSEHYRKTNRRIFLILIGMAAMIFALGSVKYYLCERGIFTECGAPEIIIVEGNHGR